MLYSISLILLVGMAASFLCRRLRLPGLLGMILTGIILGPHVLNQIDASILEISADLRKIALIIILTRAGLTLNIRDTVKVMILLSISFLLVTAEYRMATAITFSALIAVMFIGVSLQKYRGEAAEISCLPLPSLQL